MSKFATYKRVFIRTYFKVSYTILALKTSINIMIMLNNMGISSFAQSSCFLKYNYYRKNSQPLISKKISQLLSLLKIIFRIKHISPRTFQLLIRV